MDLGLRGKRALVLAASGGLGYASALELAREGAVVALCSRVQARAEKAAKAIAEETGAQVRGFAADVSRDADLKTLVETTVADLGGLDILVCNAGGPPPGGFSSLNEADWDRAYQLTLQSVVRSVRYALPQFEGGGAVLIIGSSSMKQPIPNLLLSNVFRPAVQGLCKSLASELAPKGVRVNCLSPGQVHTPRIDQLEAAQAERRGVNLDEIRRASLEAIPLGRLGKPEEFGRAAAFLCSDAASYITGSTLYVDGGSVKAL